MRFSLYEAASGLLTRFKGKDKIKRWGAQLAKRSCHRKAAVAVARKPAVVMHAMWRHGTLLYWRGNGNKSGRRRTRENQEP